MASEEKRSGISIQTLVISSLAAVAAAVVVPRIWDKGTLVASSGDLGLNWGYIRLHSPPADGKPSAFPFFTIWRRAAPDQPWRYIAE